MSPQPRGVQSPLATPEVYASHNSMRHCSRSTSTPCTKEMVEEGSKVYNRAAVAGAGGGDDGDDTPRPSGKAKGKAKAKPKARATGGAPEPIDDLSRELDEIARGEGDGDDDEGDGGFEE